MDKNNLDLMIKVLNGTLDEVQSLKEDCDGNISEDRIKDAINCLNRNLDILYKCKNKIECEIS